MLTLDSLRGLRVLVHVGRDEKPIPFRRSVSVLFGSQHCGPSLTRLNGKEFNVSRFGMGRWARGTLTQTMRRLSSASNAACSRA